MHELIFYTLVSTTGMTLTVGVVSTLLALFITHTSMDTHSVSLSNI